MIAGRYTLGREIGRGGSGTVHLGHDTVLGRDVAIKRIGMMPGADSPDLARVEREARLAAALDHPHVVAVLDLVTDGDTHWLVMEFVDGRPLSQLVREDGPLPPQRAAAILRQVADAVVEAHAATIVHRDIKPSNVLVTADDTAKLGDFGIAKATTDATLTQTGLVTGSPAYLAPEVASGASATAASDVWSLGATLFHIVTGTPPYEVTDNLVGTLYRIVHDDPPRLDPDHPLAGLVAATMVKEPAARATSSEVRDELARIELGGTPMIRPVTPTAPSPTAPSPTVRTRTASMPAMAASRSPHRWWAVGMTALALVAAVLWWMRPGDGARPDDTSDTPRAQQPADQEPSPTEPTASPTEPTASGMDAFVESYLATVTTDPEQAFTMLTPEFQQASGGYDGYVGWWGTVESARLLKIKSDPEDLIVEYNVQYVLDSGKRSTEKVELRLEHQNGTYLIAGEDD